CLWLSIAICHSLSMALMSKLPMTLLYVRCQRALQTNDLARLAHRNSFRWHRSLPWISKGKTLNRPAEALVPVPYPGRDYPVTVGGIISYWWAASFRYGGRHHLVMMRGLGRNQHP